MLQSPPGSLLNFWLNPDEDSGLDCALALQPADADPTGQRLKQLVEQGIGAPLGAGYTGLCRVGWDGALRFEIRTAPTVWMERSVDAFVPDRAVALVVEALGATASEAMVRFDLGQAAEVVGWIGADADAGSDSALLGLALPDRISGADIRIDPSENRVTVSGPVAIDLELSDSELTAIQGYLVREVGSMEAALSKETIAALQAGTALGELESIQIAPKKAAAFFKALRRVAAEVLAEDTRNTALQAAAAQLSSPEAARIRVEELGRDLVLSLVEGATRLYSAPIVAGFGLRKAIRARKVEPGTVERAALAALAGWARAQAPAHAGLGRLSGAAFVARGDGDSDDVQVADAALWEGVPAVPAPLSLGAAARVVAELPVGESAWVWATRSDRTGQPFLGLIPPEAVAQKRTLGEALVHLTRRAGAAPGARGVLRRLPSGRLLLLCEPENIEEVKATVAAVMGRAPGLGVLREVTVAALEDGSIGELSALAPAAGPLDRILAEQASLLGGLTAEDRLLFWATDAGKDGSPVVLVGRDADAIKADSQLLAGSGASVRGRARLGSDGTLRLQGRSDFPAFSESLAGWLRNHSGAHPGLSRLNGARFRHKA